MRRDRDVLLFSSLALVFGVVLVAVAGPGLAPHNPYDPHYFAVVNGAAQPPPYPPFATNEFLLGTDRLGRDTLSWLLHAIRPTLLLATSAALLRLLIGAGVGVVAGWLPSEWQGRVASAVTNAAGALPVLLVALCIVAAAGATPSVVTFLVALGITGWTDIARLAKAETALVRTQPFIEAARALGSTDWHIVRRHVVRQLRPVLLIASAFEISASTLTVASLGFLGYYVGGTAWVMVSDFGVGRAGGAVPELGQLVGFAAQRMGSLPWLMAIAGSAVFVMVAAFSAFGEAMRRRLAAETARRTSAVGRVTDFVSSQVEERLRALAEQSHRRQLALAGAGVAITAIVAGALIALQESARRPTAVIVVPGGHVWASARRDAQGTLQTDAIGVGAPTLRWSRIVSGGLTGPPAINRDGELVVAGRRSLHLLAQDGAERWAIGLDFEAAGGPALGPNGNIHVLDTSGALHAFLPSGAPWWVARLPTDAAPISSPIIGADGSVYFAVEGYVHAVTSDGKPKWRGTVPYAYFDPSPRLGPDESIVFFADTALNARTGGAILPETRDPFDQFTVGSDGRVFLFGDRDLLEWKSTETGATIVPAGKLDYTQRFPSTAAAASGVSNRRLLWLLLSNPFQDARVAWLDTSGRFVNAVNFNHRPALVVGLDGDGVLYACGRVRAGSPSAECVAAGPAEAELRWRLALPSVAEPVGGALGVGVLYVAQADGALSALAGSEVSGR